MFLINERGIKNFITIKDMETFANSENNNTLYYDFPFYKKIKLDGSLAELKNSDALAQAVKMWLVSKSNEKIRTLGGGIMYKYLGKIMDGQVASQIRFDIIQGLKNDFYPPLTPVKVEAIPDNENERWVIEIVAYNERLGIGVNTNAVVSNSML